MAGLHRVGQAAHILERVLGQHVKVLALHTQFLQRLRNADDIGQLLDGSHGVQAGQLRVVGLQDGTHFIELAGGCAHVEGLDMRQQQRIAHAVRQIVETAELVCHGVHIAERGVVEGHAGQELRVGHLLARLLVLRLAHGGGQVAGDQLDRLDGAGVGERRGCGRDIGFDGVRQRVHAGGSRQRGRHAFHHAGVVHRQEGRNVLVDDGHFHVACLVGDDGEARHLRGGAGRGVDRQQRQLRLGGLVHAFVVLDFAAVGGNQRDALGAVMRGTAAKRHDQIGLCCLERFESGVYVAHGRVGLGAIEHGGRNALRRQLVGHGVGHTDLAQTRVGDDQGLAKAHFADDLQRFVERAGANDVLHGHEEMGYGHGSLLVGSK